MSKILIGIDFSLNKPAATVHWLNSYAFYFWPYDMTETSIKKINESGVNVLPRTEIRDKNLNSSEKVRQDIYNADLMTNLIITTLNPYLNSDTLIAFEGSSFASKGNVALQLTAYRYLLMHKLTKYTSLKNMYTYAPITLKKTAGCSEKGKSKRDMIISFSEFAQDCLLKVNIKNGSLYKKKSNNFIDGIDDIVDSFWALRTLIEDINK